MCRKMLPGCRNSVEHVPERVARVSGHVPENVAGVPGESSEHVPEVLPGCRDNGCTCAGSVAGVSEPVP